MTPADPRDGLLELPECFTSVHIAGGNHAVYSNGQMHEMYRRGKADALAHARPEAVDTDKPIAWWNGISDSVLNERDGRGPSIRWGSDAENEWHDIPLYSGYNPVRAQQVALLEEAALTPERAP